MKAILVNPIDRSLSWSEVPTPEPAEGEVLVEVHYAALNRADLMQRAGDYPPPPGCPEWMGLEISGVIVSMTEDARAHSHWKIGDTVCALLGGGGYAEYAAVRHDMLMPVPEGVSLMEAACMPEAFATAYLNLFYVGGLSKGNTLLMHAGASGLASVVIPMAKAFGARVITSVQTRKQCSSISGLGADTIICQEDNDIVDALKDITRNGSIDLAIDCLGGKMMGASLPFMSFGGRWIMIATLAGDLTQVDLKLMYKKNLSIIGSTLRSKTPEMKAQILADLVRNVWPKVTAGQVRPTLYRALPIQQAEEAHDILQRGENIGKVVLIVKE